MASGGADAPRSAVGLRHARLGVRRVPRRSSLYQARLRTQRNHEVGFRLVGGYLHEGRPPSRRDAGSPPITTAVIDTLYEKLLTVTETDAAGN